MIAGIVRLIAFALLFAWIVVAVGTTPVQGQSCPGVTSPLHPILGSFQQLTVSTTAVGLTVPRGTKMTVLSVESNPIRYRDDLTDPTAAVGVLVGTGSTLVLCGDSVSRFRAIRQTGSDALLNVSFYGG